MVITTGQSALTVTFAGTGDPFGSGGRNQACIHLRPADGDQVLLDCGATLLSALKRLGPDPGEIAAVFVSHLHGDHSGGLPFHPRRPVLWPHPAADPRRSRPVPRRLTTALPAE